MWLPPPGAWIWRITGDMTTPGDPREREAAVATRVHEAAVTADVREEVVRRLDTIEREEDVRVLYATNPYC